MSNPETRKCVFFLGWKDSATNKIKWGGTGFLVALNVRDDVEVRFAVTARHCIEGLENRSADGKVYVRFNRVDGTSETLATTNWTFHPDHTVDVAVNQLGGDFSLYDLLVISSEAFVDDATSEKYEIGEGDEVLVTGLFHGHPGTDASMPIIRVGNIAAIPSEKVWTDRYNEIDALLIECRSFGGLSGSPVFVVLDPWVNIKTGEAMSKASTSRPRRAIRLLGLIHGHFDSEAVVDSVGTVDDVSSRGVNMGIAIVIPAEKILEAMMQPSIKSKIDLVLAELDSGRRQLL